MGLFDRKIEVEGVNYFGKPKLPPGQTPTVKFPVLSYGEIPSVTKDRWHFVAWGLVEKEGDWSGDYFM